MRPGSRAVCGGERALELRRVSGYTLVLGENCLGRGHIPGSILGHSRTFLDKGEQVGAGRVQDHSKSRRVGTQVSLCEGLGSSQGRA